MHKHQDDSWQPPGGARITDAVRSARRSRVSSPGRENTLRTSTRSSLSTPPIKAGDLDALDAAARIYAPGIRLRASSGVSRVAFESTRAHWISPGRFARRRRREVILGYACGSPLVSCPSRLYVLKPTSVPLLVPLSEVAEILKR
jgi:hypothetical protein